jgi:hypothetical protein
MLTTINDKTKVRVWLERINDLVNGLNIKNYSWDTTSIKGQPSYTFSKSLNYREMPPDSEYVVYYSGIELDKDDYKIEGDVLTFTSAPEEDGCSIRVRYLRDVRDV